MIYWNIGAVWKLTETMRNSFNFISHSAQSVFKKPDEKLKFLIILELKSKRPCKYVSNNVKKAEVFNISTAWPIPVFSRFIRKNLDYKEYILL